MSARVLLFARTAPRAPVDVSDPAAFLRDLEAQDGEQLLAPEDRVTVGDTVSPDVLSLFGRDDAGRVRVRIELAAHDVDQWWIDVIRRALVERYDVLPRGLELVR